MTRKVPRLLLCAPASGGGKTTVTCALLQALVDRGAAPVAYKCGPDYIDPMFHSEVIGAKSRNLDLFLMGEEAVCRSLAENTPAGSTAVIEGVMGYYDGIAMSSQASAYDLARTTDTPAVLVADARGRALTAAALVKGMATFRTDANIQGVILNRCPPMMYLRLKETIEAETGVQVYGYLPNLPECALESRHLGLVTAAEVGDLRQKLRRMAEQAEQTIDIDVPEPAQFSGVAGLAGKGPHHMPVIAPIGVCQVALEIEEPTALCHRGHAVEDGVVDLPQKGRVSGQLFGKNLRVAAPQIETGAARGRSLVHQWRELHQLRPLPYQLTETVGQLQAVAHQHLLGNALKEVVN